VIQKQSQEIQELRQDLVQLNQKYVDQIERVQTAEQAKYQVESELEDLSLRLFEQANHMVSDEKKARFDAEKRISKLERELTAVYEELGNERAQLNELRVKLHKESTHGCHGVPTAAYLDNGWLNLFKRFLTLAPETPLEQIHKLPFLKQCLELDIEPCLRLGGHNAKGGQLSMRRVLDVILHQPCFIESETAKRYSHDDRMPLSSAASPPPPPLTVCYGCGMELEAPLFRFRLKEQDPEYFTIDQPCRDRLVAVC
ncbi:hypothetical protein BD408DRAFT_318242, partial [Parasitella parasitica]